MITAIIQARVGSTRLPRKVLLRAGGKTFLEQCIRRIKRSKTVQRIIVATTVRKEDAAIERIAKRCKVGSFRGSETDVLDRYYRAAAESKSDIIVRITADCPLLDPAVLDRVVRRFLANRSRLEYVSNVHPPTFPDGMDVEVFSFRALERAWKEASRPSEREHVTAYIASHRNRFRTANVVHASDLSSLRLTLDEPADALMLRRLLRMLVAKHGEAFGLKEILELCRERPALFSVNRHIERNEGYVRSLVSEALHATKTRHVMRLRALIVVLAGTLVRDAAGWRTTSFSERNGLGDCLRVEAAAKIYASTKGARRVLVLGGQGTLRPEAPAVAEVVKRELMALGVRADDIFTECRSGTTYEQLRALSRLVPKWQSTQMLLVSNAYHLPRVRMFIKKMDALSTLQTLVGQNKLIFVAAEKALARGALHERDRLANVYSSRAVQKIIASEKKGVVDLRAGRYRFFGDITIRRATDADALFLYKLRNDPDVRRVSLHQNPILYATHLEWLRRKLADTNTALFIVELERKAIGQVRFDIREGEPDAAEISIALMRAYRGKGYGGRIIILASERFLSGASKVQKIFAYINLDNVPSRRSFEKAGFRLMGKEKRKGRTRWKLRAYLQSNRKI